MKKMKALLCLICMFALAVSPSLAAERMVMPTVETTGGKLVGFMNGSTYTFLGIQYATAERFEPAQPVSWEGTRIAQNYGPVAPVGLSSNVSTSEVLFPHRYGLQNEECLYLNVWTQSMDTDAKKPVMFWLHGGGYGSGSSIEGITYDGKNLSEFGDVVVVSINHRLNSLGYMDFSSLGEGFEDSVNLGMLDIVAALQWVHDNIEQFGGDPDNVTIFGQSGGGGKVLSLMCMPSAEGLFSKAIAQSAYQNSVTAPALDVEDLHDYQNINDGTAAANAAAVLKNLGLDESTKDQIRTVSYTELTAAVNAARSDLRQQGISYSAGPVIDGVTMLPTLCDWAKDVTFMNGNVFVEVYYSGDAALTGTAKHVNDWTEEETLEKLTASFGDNAAAIAEEWAKVYPDKPVGNACSYATTWRMWTKRAADLVSSLSNMPTYNYVYSYELPFNGGTPAFHCSELHMVFHNLDLPDIYPLVGDSQEARKVEDTVCQAWVNFAYTGNPSQEGLEWLPYTAEQPNTMMLDVNSVCKDWEDSRLIELMMGK